MSGRARGGKMSSLTQEQLQTLGCIGKDMPQVQTTPPPTFPTLMSKPVTLETTAAQNYQILWKEDFVNHMRDSQYFLAPKVAPITSIIQRYSDQWASALENSKMKAKADFNFSLMPSELQPVNRKRRIAIGPNVADNLKKTKVGNIEDRLKVLEEKERTDENKDVAVNKANSDTEQEEEEEELAADEEMDDENDYGNSYFDNGEAYNEEDDNMDDGPVFL